MSEINNTQERIFYEGGENPKPATNTTYFRLYGHNLCPFDARTRYILSAKQVEFQECFLGLDNRGQWHKDFNEGKIPVLETPQGELIPESGIISQFAMETNPTGGIQLVPSDPMVAAHMRVRME